MNKIKNIISDKGQLSLFSESAALRKDAVFPSLKNFLEIHPHANFYQSPDFFELIEDVKGFKPFQLVAQDGAGLVVGSLLGVFQSNGSGVKSWMSRRLIVWGGPLVKNHSGHKKNELALQLIMELKKYAGGKAIFIEFRNFFDTADLKYTFETCGFNYNPHLNLLVRTDEEAAVRKRMSKSKMRQIKSSLKLGAEICEAQNETEVMDFYAILKKLYKEKVKKPLAGPDLFLKCFQSESCKIFLVKQEGSVIGGIVSPVFGNKVIYEWYVCGEDGQQKGLHPSVLATWAPIEYGFQNGFDHFDFMGAGKPDQDYGVREFKARFGGAEVAYGRYEMILNNPLYEMGKMGLKVYQKLK